MEAVVLVMKMLRHSIISAWDLDMVPALDVAKYKKKGDVQFFCSRIHHRYGEHGDPCLVGQARSVTGGTMRGTGQGLGRLL